jgi:hypothetical protein
MGNEAPTPSSTPFGRLTHREFRKLAEVLEVVAGDGKKPNGPTTRHPWEIN